MLCIKWNGPGTLNKRKLVYKLGEFNEENIYSNSFN